MRNQTNISVAAGQLLYYPSHQKYSLGDIRAKNLTGNSSTAKVAIVLPLPKEPIKACRSFVLVAGISAVIIVHM